jgi:prepilin-type N-terminal cleavage/methylation domain-containing protein
VFQAIQRRLAARQGEDNQSGFTLIELMVVVMIIAILVGIAIPAFLGARKRAQDTAAKSNLRNALSTAQTIFTDNQTYGDSASLVTSLGSEEPSLTFKDHNASSGKAKEISVKTVQTAGGTTPYDELIMASDSGSGKCFFLRHIATAGYQVTIGGTATTISGSYMASAADTAGCAADNAPADNTTSWTAL